MAQDKVKIKMEGTMIIKKRILISYSVFIAEDVAFSINKTISSIENASLTLKSPMASLLSDDRKAPDCNALPKSYASDLI